MIHKIHLFTPTFKNVYYYFILIDFFRIIDANHGDDSNAGMVSSKLYRWRAGLKEQGVYEHRCKQSLYLITKYILGL